MILRGGENISCATVENALASHPSVVEACVYALPDARLGELVGATVAVRERVQEEEMRQHCKGLLAAFEVPAHVRVIEGEKLPRLASHKIDKKSIMQQHVSLMTAKL